MSEDLARRAALSVWKFEPAYQALQNAERALAQAQEAALAARAAWAQVVGQRPELFPAEAHAAAAAGTAAVADEAGPGEMPTKPKGKKAPTSAAASTGTVDRAVKALESKGLIAKTTKGWEVVDPLMRLWLQQNAPIVR